MSKINELSNGMSQLHDITDNYIHKDFSYQTYSDVKDFLFLLDELMRQHEPPTFDEVVNAWEDTIDDKLEFKNNDEGIRIIYPNGIYYLINRELVYSNRKVFSMNVNATLYAINLTIRYLEAKEKVNE